MADTDFYNKVIKQCKKIPKGKVSTYKLIAKEIKEPKSVRAVGNTLNKNKNLIVMPCHRVVRSDGSVGGYAKGADEKVRILKSEGIKINNSKIDLTKYLYKF